MPAAPVIQRAPPQVPVSWQPVVGLDTQPDSLITADLTAFERTCLASLFAFPPTVGLWKQRHALQLQLEQWPHRFDLHLQLQHNGSTLTSVGQHRLFTTILLYAGARQTPPPTQVALSRLLS